jgi:hypothetical protein
MLADIIDLHAYEAINVRAQVLVQVLLGPTVPNIQQDIDIVGHPAFAGAHDDVACAAAGALVATAQALPLMHFDLATLERIRRTPGWRNSPRQPRPSAYS